MNNNNLNPVQRTLIITCGPLAQETGEKVAAHLTDRSGPRPAIAIQAVETAALDESGVTAITTALTQISPPNLSAILASQGWQLINEAEINYILLCDAAAESGDIAGKLLEQVSALVYRHLGIETASLLIWLVGETGDAFLADCLSAPINASRGTAVLSLRNEAGLRLPDESALAQLGAELLTCLTATPLRDLPEQIAVVNGASFAAEPPLFSVGLHGWRWSPAKTHCCFTNRWLENVVTHWLAAADDAPLLETVTLWLQTEGITLDNLAAPLLKEAERSLPHLNVPGWQMPWPWDFAALITEMNFTSAADGERCTQIQAQAALRLAEPLQQATSKLQNFVQTLLDNQPTAGLSHTQCWLQQASDVWDIWMDEVLDKADRLAADGADLGGSRGQLEADIQQRMAGWPAVSTAAWLNITLRPWRWPRLAWQYRRLRELGQQLTDVLTRQAEWRRQTVLNQLLRRTVADLDHFTRHLHGQVEEIGDMLQHLAAENLPARGDVAASREERFSLITHLSVPWKLYEQLIPDAAAEAITAAAAIGGLGRQVKLLDDTIWEPLRRFGKERLASVWDLTAVDVLSTWSDNHDSLRPHWQAAWDAARPLWRLEEALLDETVRGQDGRHAFVCGADVSLLADLLPDQETEVIWLASSDRASLWLARVQVGAANALPAKESL